jgi:hypothetical protein
MAIWRTVTFLVTILFLVQTAVCRITDASVVRDDRAIILIATPFGYLHSTMKMEI